MISVNKFLSSVLFFLLLTISAYAQDKNSDKKSDFDKYKAFSELFMEDQANSFHSATGNPGPEYWQNQADYKIKATLDPVNNTITGEMTLTYTNNSPYDMKFFWLQLDQNTFRKDSRGSALYPKGDRNGVRYFTDGYELKNIAVGKQKADFIVDDTRLKVNLPKTLKSGKKVKLDINYSFEIPTHGKDRMGRLKTKNGTIYTIAQWYPRMAVYDEVEGWNNLPYLGTGEFYLEYGNFDYEITVPDNMLVVGSGILQNENKVLTKKQRDRLKRAKESDETVMIKTKEEMKAGTYHVNGKDGMLTWHFKMKNSRDVSWAASTAFIWDAARLNLPEGKKALAQSVYPEENSGQDGYGRSTEYTKNAIEINSKNWYAYPYEVATNVGAHEGGMEYPGIVFCSYKSKNSSLWGVINHEFGHTWFPMIVGSNERKYAWLDEGLNTFTNDVATEEFNNGEYAKDTYLNSYYSSMMFNDNLVPLFTRADVIHDQMSLGILGYMKPATMLQVLRNVVLGKKRFDQAFRTYINRWAYKHPQPWDFFNTMSNASGEDLGWFFKGWVMHNWSIDQSVESIKYVDDDYTKGAEITLANNGEMPMPVLLEITYEDGQKDNVKLPVEIWYTGKKYVYHLESNQKIKSVVIDPENLVPDANPMSKKLKKLDPAPKGVTAKKVIDDYINNIGGRQKLESVKDISKKMNATVQGMSLTIEEYRKAPNKYLQMVKMNGQTFQKILVNGDDVQFYRQGKKLDLSNQQKEQFKNQQDELFPELNYEKSENNLKLLGVKTEDGDEVYVIQITDKDGNTTKEYFKTENGLKTKSVSSKGGENLYSDYKTEDGIKIPHKVSSTQQGYKTDLTIKEIKINSGLKDSEFK